MTELVLFAIGGTAAVAAAAVGVGFLARYLIEDDPDEPLRPEDDR